MIQIHTASNGEDIKSPALISKLEYQGSGSESYPFMSFLDPYIVSRRTRGNIESTIRHIHERNGILKMEEVSNGFPDEQLDRFGEIYSDDERETLENSETEQDDGIGTAFENCEGSAIVYLSNTAEPHCERVTPHLSRRQEECEAVVSVSEDTMHHKKKRKKVDHLLESKIKKCVNDCIKLSPQQTLQPPQLKDEDELFGLMIGSQLRGMTAEQKMVAKYHITSVINQVRMPGVLIKGEVRIPNSVASATPSVKNAGNGVISNGEVTLPAVSHQHMTSLSAATNHNSQ